MEVEEPRLEPGALRYNVGISWGVIFKEVIDLKGKVREEREID